MATKPAAKKPAKTEDEPKATRLTVNGKPYEIDGENLTWGEMALIERHYGSTLDDLGNVDSFLALATLAVRREDPEWTFTATEALPLAAIKVNEESRPTSAPDVAGSPS